MTDDLPVVKPDYVTTGPTPAFWPFIMFFIVFFIVAVVALAAHYAPSDDPKPTIIPANQVCITMRNANGSRGASYDICISDEMIRHGLGVIVDQATPAIRP